jgi:hypothetical protein
VHKKYIASVLIPSFMIQLCGCYSMKEIPKDEFGEGKEENDIVIYTKDSTYFFFGKNNYTLSNDSLSGKGHLKNKVDSDFETPFEGKISLNNIEMMQHEELNPTKTTWLIIGGILLVAAVVFGIQIISYVSGI